MKNLSTRNLQQPINLFCILVITLALLLPNQLSAFDWADFVALPLEALLLGLGLLLPGRAGKVFRIVAAVIFTLGILLKFADMAVFQIFARPFNPVLDAFFFVNGMNLLNGALGHLLALLVAVLLGGLVLAIVAFVFWLLKRAQQQLHLAPKTSLGILLAGLVVWFFIVVTGRQGASKISYDQLAEHVSAMYRSYAELEQFHQEIAIDPVLDKTPAANVFSKLKGKDVLVVFIESYGRIVLDKPEFAEHIRPLLQQASGEFAAHGIGTRSAYLTSSTLGGLSWLAHGTAMSGLWIDSQVRYDSLIMSQRPSLNRLFKDAGWRTLAVMPAITMAWPEGNYFGYSHIYAANDLGYKGLPFNWVTMPDQYTLAAFQALERKPGHAPVMTEMALISSHAPWTPIPALVDWNAVGDGTIFNAQAASGDSPEIVWQDNQRIRTQFRKSIEYALANLVSYATTYGDDNLVILAFGDHQPAPLVTGATANRDVIVHLIARDPKVLEDVASWQWTEGMLPAGNAPVWRMDEVRTRLLETFSGAQ
ncbi:MAG: sulfatase-like hydrolase/transferase [Pseudomonadota bacterium]